MSTRRRRAVQFEHPEGSVRFTVQEVCEAELNAAVDAYVRNQNHIAAHLLASAAHEIMRGYAKKHDIPLVADLVTFFRKIAPEYADTVAIGVQLPYNSMKHFTGASDAVTVHPLLPEVQLLFSVKEFISLFSTLSPRMATFLLWMTSARPELTIEDGPRADCYFKSAKLDLPLVDRLKEARKMLGEIDKDPEMFAQIARDHQAAQRALVGKS